MTFDYVRPYVEGVAIFSQGGLSGLIDQAGYVIVDAAYDWIDMPNQGRAVFKVIQRPLYGVMDLTGNILCEPGRFDRFHIGYSEGRLGFCKDGLWGFIDLNCNIVAPPSFHDLGMLSEGLAWFKRTVKNKSHFGFVDTNGSVVIEAQFDKVRPFQNGSAAVCLQNQWFHVGRTGEKLYEHIRPAPS